MQVLTARKNKHQDSFGRSTSSGSMGTGASVSRLNSPPGTGSGSGLTTPAAPQQQQAPVQPPPPSYLDAFTELQQVCHIPCVYVCAYVCSCVSVFCLARHTMASKRRKRSCLLPVVIWKKLIVKQSHCLLSICLLSIHPIPFQKTSPIVFVSATIPTIVIMFFIALVLVISVSRASNSSGLLLYSVPNIYIFLQAMDSVHMSSGPPTPQQGDPFASSYMHPSSNSNQSASDPFSHASSAQPSYGQPPSGQAPRDQGSFGQSSFGQPSFGHPIDNQSSFGQSSAGQQPSFGQSSFGQAPQVPQQQAPIQGGGASHNPFAAPGGFGGSSFGNAGVQHVTVHSASLHDCWWDIFDILRCACLLHAFAVHVSSL